jgi:hypothetical protein
MSVAETSFIVAASALLLEAVGYTFGALRPLCKALAPSDPYLKSRLLLNLMLANAGLYLTSLYTFAGAVIEGMSQPAASTVLGITLLACTYSLVTVPVLTPRDWGHTLFRAAAAALIIAGLLVRG